MLGTEGDVLIGIKTRPGVLETIAILGTPLAFGPIGLLYLEYQVYQKATGAIDEYSPGVSFFIL